MAIIVKGSTKRGQKLIKTGTHWEGNDLCQVYNNWSYSKQQAFDECWEDYLATPEHDAWGICSHNTSFFSVSWVGLYEGENALYLRTGQTDYIVLLDK